MTIRMMKIHCLQTAVLPLLAIALLGGSCNGPFSKDSIREIEHPKLIKKIGDPRYGHVRCGLRQKDGDLWFGTTENGLYRFDGKDFRQFLEADGLVSNSINDILEDDEGGIWVATEDGVSFNDGKTFVEIRIPVPESLSRKRKKFYRSQKVYDIMRDKSGKLWFATIDGVYFFDGESFNRFMIDEDANGFLGSEDKIEHMLEDASGDIWFGGRTNEGVYRYDGKSVTRLNLEELMQNGPSPKAHKWA